MTPSDPMTLRGSFLTNLFIYTSCPPNVHKLVFDNLSASTQAAHIRALRRLKAMDADVARWPLAKAVVEQTLRRAQECKWAWSTVASALSSAASAINLLPIYTNAPQGVDLRDDPYYKQAQRHAGHLARLGSLTPRASQPLTAADYENLTRRIASPEALDLLLLAWSFAIRVGNARRIHPEHVHFEKRDKGTQIRLTIVQGKSVQDHTRYTTK